MAELPELGLVIGKFIPLHVGHVRLLLGAAARCQQLLVIVGDRRGDTIPAATRAAWIAEMLGDHAIETIVVLDDLPEAPGPWAERTLECVAPRVPDVVFTAEEYGDSYCSLMGQIAKRTIVHVRLPKEVETSGTALRGGLNEGGSWQLLSPAARAGLARRVVVLGCESSGTTTLAKALAARFSTVWVPEYGRFYWEGREHAAMADGGEAWEEEEFVTIATEQQRIEDRLAKLAQKLVVCDTDGVATMAWHKRYRGSWSELVERIADSREYCLYLLTAPDFGFVDDGTREDGQHRLEMHEDLKRLLTRKGRRFVEVGGSREERVAAAAAAIEPLLVFPDIVTCHGTGDIDADGLDSSV